MLEVQIVFRQLTGMQLVLVNHKSVNYSKTTFSNLP